MALARGSHQGCRPAAESPQSLRLYRHRLAGRSPGRRRGHPYRRVAQGDRLGQGKPDRRRARGAADPLDLRGRGEIRRTRDPARPSLRRDHSRPAEIRPRPKRRGLGYLHRFAENARRLSPAPLRPTAIPYPHRLLDPRILLRHRRACRRMPRRPRRRPRIGASWFCASKAAGAPCRRRCSAGGRHMARPLPQRPARFEKSPASPIRWSRRSVAWRWPRTARRAACSSPRG